MLATSSMTKTRKTQAGYSQTALSVKRPTNDILLVYRLLRTIDNSGKNRHGFIYSISLVMIDESNRREEEYIYDISRKGEEAKRIFRLLSENTVTPCAVYEVIDDYFASI